MPALASVAMAKVLPAGKRGGALGVVASSLGIGFAFIQSPVTNAATNARPDTLDAAPFSDAFLAIVPALIIALIAAFGLLGNIEGNKQSEQFQEGEAE